MAAPDGVLPVGAGDIQRQFGRTIDNETGHAGGIGLALHGGNGDTRKRKRPPVVLATLTEGLDRQAGVSSSGLGEFLARMMNGRKAGLAEMNPPFTFSFPSGGAARVPLPRGACWRFDASGGSMVVRGADTRQAARECVPSCGGSLC